MKHSMMLILITIILIPGLAVGAGGTDVKPLAVELLPLHPVYKVNEPIRFRIKVNQDFYLYVWQVDEKKKVRRALTLNLFNEVDLYEGEGFIPFLRRLISQATNPALKSLFSWSVPTRSMRPLTLSILFAMAVTFLNNFLQNALKSANLMVGSNWLLLL